MMNQTFALLILSCSLLSAAPDADQLQRWLKKFPQADSNKDGILTIEEVNAYRKTIAKKPQGNSRQKGTPRTFDVDPGWDAERFPEHAVCYQTAEQIKATYAKTLKAGQSALTSYPKPENGALRIVGTGHSFMAPGYKSLPLICKAAGFKQPLLTHTGGGMTGSARYKWEQENGIFQFDGKPTPKLLASISNAEWEAMMWGPYFNDRAVGKKERSLALA